MLRKLLKHEFRATARVMGPVYLVLLVTALGANLSTRGIMDSSFTILRILGRLLALAFVVAILAVCVVSFLLMLQRFYKNLLGDEGYLMFTLPVSVHQQIWSKLIVSSVWFIATGVAVMISFAVMALNISFLEGFARVMKQIFENMTTYYAINGTLFMVELVVLAFVACIAFSLQFYAAMAVGHSFSNHKTAWSVAFFFIFQFAVQMIGGVLLAVMSTQAVSGLIWKLQIPSEGITGLHLGMGVMILASVVYGAVFYVVTTYFLKKHLNLE